MSDEILEKFAELIEKVKQCYQCGTCAGGCPVFRVHPEFNPRIIMETLLSGDTGQLFIEDLVWYCSMCYTCSVRCPQGVDVAHVLVELKNLSKKMKNVPEGILAEIEAIKEAGITAAISESILKKREKLGLPELPKTNTVEIQKLMDVIGVVDDLKQVTESQMKAKEDIS